MELLKSAWETLLLAVGGTSILLVFITWLAQKLIVNILKRDISQFNIELQSKKNELLEEVKTKNQAILEDIKEKKQEMLEEFKAQKQEALKKMELEIKHEKDIFLKELDLNLGVSKFKREKLHDKQMNLLSELYGKICSAKQATLKYTIGFQQLNADRDLQLKTAVKSIDELSGFLEVNRLFFNERICELVDHFDYEIKGGILKLGQYNLIDPNDPNVPQEDKIAHSQTWREVDLGLSNILPEIMELINLEFRKHLGVSES